MDYGREYSVKVVVRGKKIPNLRDAADIADLVNGGGTKLTSLVPWKLLPHWLLRVLSRSSGHV
jgi:hypothetical protein